MVEESKVIMYHNKKYVIIRMIKLYDINYAYLTNIKDESDFFFGKFVNNELIEVTDEKFINLLIEKM